MSANEISTSASSGTASALRKSSSFPQEVWRDTGGPAAGPWPGRMLAPAIGSRSVPISARGKSFDEAIADFSSRYADQNELDYSALAAAARSGEIKAESDLNR